MNVRRKCGLFPKALKMAVENGADVINMSLDGLARGAAVPDDMGCRHPLGHHKHVVLVAAAGNRGNRFSNRDAPEIPAIHPDVISVAATTQSGARAPFSTSNRWVNIAAPGLLIYSTVRASGLRVQRRQQRHIDGGTDVSGVVAHMKARYPDATPVQIRQAMFSTALQPRSTRTGVRTDDFGWGMIQPPRGDRRVGLSCRRRHAAPRFTSPSQRSVAENMTGAGAVAAVDEDDAVTGYAISGAPTRGCSL